MRLPRHAPAIELTAEQRSELQRLARASGSAQQAVRRARIVLLAAQGQPNDDIATTLETSPPSVSKWRRRFARQGLAGLDDAPRSGRPIRLSADQLHVVLTQVTPPPKTRTRWRVRSMARPAGVSKSHVQQLWKDNDLKPP